jgi:hypothetical protein
MTFHNLLGVTNLAAAEIAIINARKEDRKSASRGTSASHHQKWFPIALRNHNASVPHSANRKQLRKMRRNAWMVATAASGKLRPSLKVWGIARRWMPGVPVRLGPSNARRNSDLIFCRSVGQVLANVIA